MHFKYLLLCSKLAHFITYADLNNRLNLNIFCSVYLFIEIDVIQKTMNAVNVFSRIH
jgi:hypothetical protein